VNDPSARDVDFGEAHGLGVEPHTFIEYFMNLGSTMASQGVMAPTYVVSIGHPEGEGDSRNTDFLFREAPEVQQCYLVTGKASFILILLVPDMASYEVLSRRLFADNELVQSFQTLVVLDPVKVTLEVDV